MESDLQKAVRILRAGGVIAYPTDTVYGLGAHAFHKAAVERIYRIKGRPITQPLSVLIAGIGDVESLVEDFSPLARALAERFWPGGLTIVLRRRPSVPSWITSGQATIGLRVPDHPLALELIRGLGAPLIGTSANLSGRPSCATAGEVQEELAGAVDFILDGGRCPGGIESTVVDATAVRPVILREGAIASGDILAVWESAPGRVPGSAG